MSQPSRTAYVMTGRAVTAAGLALLMLTLLWLTGNPWFLLLAGAVAGALVVALAGRARLDGLTVEVVHPPRVAVGDTLHTVLTVTNDGSRTSSECSLCVHTAGMSDLVASVGRLLPGDRVTLSVPRLGTSRTVADGTLVHLVARPGLGTLAGTRTVHLPDRVTVHPRLHDLPELPVAWTDVDGTDDLGRRRPGQRGARRPAVARRGRPPADPLAQHRPHRPADPGRARRTADHPPARPPGRLGRVPGVRGRGQRRGLGVRPGVAARHDGHGRRVAARRPGPGADRVPVGAAGLVVRPGRHRVPRPGRRLLSAYGGLAGGEWLVAGPVEVLDEWLAPARRAGSGLVLHRMEGLR